MSCLPHSPWFDLPNNIWGMSAKYEMPHCAASSINTKGLWDRNGSIHAFLMWLENTAHRIN
jgi:hypothetical protein